MKTMFLRQSSHSLRKITFPRPFVRRHSTFIEILIAMVIVTILASILLPGLNESRQRAKFVRWLAYNKTWSNDPDCVINYNFQEGSGNTLNNTALACSDIRFDSTKYNGTLMSNATGTNHNFKWIPGGRFGKWKRALQFNGTDTYVSIPTTESVNFTPWTDFTVCCWLKFDTFGFGDCPFSKSLWGTAADASAQFDMYAHPFAGSKGQGSFDVDAFTQCITWLSTDVDFNQTGWTHLALRYTYVRDIVKGKEVECQIMGFVNGKPLGTFVNYTTEDPATASATDWTNSLNIPCVLGGAGCYRKYWSPSTYVAGNSSVDNILYVNPAFIFKGRMDEFMLFKRGLTSAEIAGMYEMGRE